MKSEMGIPLRVLMVEDSEDDAALIVHNLKRGGYDPIVNRVETAAEMETALVQKQWDIVLCDYCMPQFSTVHALDVVHRSQLDLPFIIVSATIGEEVAVAIMKAGAHDYVMKGNLARLSAAIERELREAEIRQERRRVEEKMKQMAFYDPLTGLPNRNLFHDRLDQAILGGQREKTTVALLLIDIDRFKDVNDTLGHQQGDIVLQQVGRRIQALLRKSDTIAHLGGDEYGVLLPETGVEGAISTSNKILAALEKPIVLNDLPLCIEVSIGIALFPEHGGDTETLLRRVDMAMYVAKQGGNRHTVYVSELDRHSAFRLTLISELRRAIENDDLFLVYQPKVDMKKGCTIGVEALVRWQHGDRGLILPESFITLAERTGLIKSLTLWVLKASIQQCRQWQLNNLPLDIAVNLSARNLHDPELSEKIADLLSTSGLPAEKLQLEITESAIMVDLGRAMENLNRLREIGIRLSIDDFGTGHSSLSYLKKLPVNELKIDMSFIKDMDEDDDDAVIVKSTIDLGHNLGLSVVAEGVEKESTWNRLLKMGCDSAQGYYMSHPIEQTELTRWLQKTSWGLSMPSQSLPQIKSRDVA